jgi:heat shock protein HslJ/outer membrane murein-binding lipoprotein Lpp
MRKKITTAAAALLITVSLIFAGCSGGISENDYDKAVTERDQALAQVAELENDITSLQAQIDALEATTENLDALQTELFALKIEKTGLEAEIKTIHENFARYFVEHEATYLFDGMEETLTMTAADYSADGAAWVITFTFDSRQAGYGDREGQMLAQVITPHEAILKLRQGSLESAVMDGQWNMVNQRMIYAVEEVTWVMTSMTGENVTHQAIEGVDVTLFLNSTNGYVGGSAGCNSYGAPYEINADNLTLSESIIQTLMLCADEAVNEQEFTYLTALQAAESWVVGNDTLTIAGGDWTIEFARQQ